ncbi:single-stranded DNA-binding protein [Arthrobacter sp. NPDC056691]|uniref:single-stranded DNA-binding protein n=1 Tax=Arthrobacter sp. NPDC056691 TaxID=3345913 RepID=UPI00366C306C
MSNPRNNGTVIGRLASDPRHFTNQDGSKKVVFTIMADRNWTNAQNERQADGIPVEAFVRAVTQGLGPYSNIHKGDLVAVNTSLRMDRYTRNGDQVFDLKVIAEDITFLESKAVTQARLADRVVAAEAENKAAALAAVPAAQPAVAAVVTTSAVDEQLPFQAA